MDDWELLHEECDLITAEGYMLQKKHFRVVNTWNGGKGGRAIVYVSSETGIAGTNQCFKWIHDNTPFSFHEATVNQGYVVEEVGGLNK